MKQMEEELHRSEEQEARRGMKTVQVTVIIAW